MPAPTTITRHPVVLRFAGISPSDLAKYEMHRKRTGGDLGHVDTSRSGLNRLLIGTADWADRAVREVERMRQGNFVAELESLARRNRQKDIERRTFEGPRNPWRATRHGPMREVILTANKKWFDHFEVVDGRVDFEVREKQFEALAVEWLQENFKADVIHARADRDETAYHIHAVILPRANVSINGGHRQMLQPSIHPLIKNYEAAQNSVGEFFSQIGLTRGERRKQAFRDAIINGQEPPEKRMHVSPVQWRRSEDCRLAQQKEKLDIESHQVAEREAAADVIIATAEGIADGSLEIAETPDGLEVRTSPAFKNGPERDSLLARLRKSKAGQTRAVQAFASAWNKITGSAKAAAEAKARADLKRDFDDIKAAKEAVAEIASLLPEPIRLRVARAHRDIAARLFGIGKSLRPETPPQPPKSHGSDQGTEEK